MLREGAFEVDLGDEDREQHRAHDHAEAETPVRAALAARAARTLPAPFVVAYGLRPVAGSRPGRQRWPVHGRRGSTRHGGGTTCGWSPTTASGSRSSSRAAARRCCWCTASAARRRTSPTTSTRSRRTHHVVTFDHRGHGESDSPTDAAVVLARPAAADTLAVADAVGADQFRLLGHSMGGMVVRRVVLAQPERVDALVLMDTSPGPVPGHRRRAARDGRGDRARRGHGRAQADHGRVPAARAPPPTSGCSPSGPATRSSTTGSGRRSRR